ncbi:restriction endonuclease subunit S [Vibrio fortis]|uniref:restriction endonuclease subunit S n=1 Tax=Vibrio fortis TaxID=212667 RepID=UPI0021C2996C|nr:restriction endonuclease subunit S [Vibrio fortis]
MSWPIVTLGNLVDVKGGKRLPKGESYHQSETKHPYIRVTDFINGSVNIEGLEYISEETHNKIQRYTISKNDVYISIAGSIGIVGKIPPSLDGANLTENAAKLVIKDDQLLDQDFLIRFLSTQGQDQIQSKKKATSQPKLALFRIEEIEVPLPPLEEQKRIAAILDKADAIRQKRKQAIDLADEFLRSVFLDMFGDPVTNPKGWEVEKLIDLVDKSRSISYGIVQRGAECDGGVPVVRISDFTTNEFIPNKIVRCAPNISEKYTRTILSGNELVISIRGTVGRVAKVPKSAKGWNVSREVAVIPLIDRYLRLFFKCLLLSSPIQRKLIDNVRGVAQSGISLEDLRNLDVIVPDLSKVEEFYSIVELCQKSFRDEYVGEKSHLFNSLSQKAFSGQL